MADRKISELTNITGANLADTDEFVVVDTSASETKAITYGELKKFTGTVTADGLIIDDSANSGTVTTTMASNVVTHLSNGSGAFASERWQLNDGGTPSTRMTLSTSGLDVTGTVTADGLTVSNTSVVAGDFDGGTAATYIRLQDDTDNFFIGTNNGLGSFLIKNETADALRLTVGRNGDISFYEATGTTPKFFWDASAEALGIGTSSPVANTPLTLQGPSGYTDTLWLKSVGTNIDSRINIAPTGTGNAQINNTVGTAIEFQTSGAERMRIDASGMLNAYYGISVDGGTIKLDGNYPVGTNNVALGDGALDAVDSGAIANIAIGHGAATALISGDENTAIGNASLATATTAINNTAVGSLALQDTTTGSYNVAVGKDALQSNTTASNNTAVGYQAGYSNTAGAGLVAVGKSALSANTTGNYNIAIGQGSLFYHTTGSSNTAVGHEALVQNTTASQNTAVGYRAGYSQTTAIQNTLIGSFAGYSLTTGGSNTFIGGRGGTTGAGDLVTTGSKNTIIGGYNGNQGGLDIRTSNNNIVLSDGDGNPRIYVDSSDAVRIPGSSAASPHVDASGIVIKPSAGILIGVDNTHAIIAARHNGNGEVIRLQRNNTDVGSIDVTTTSTSYNTTSDHRLKENVVELTGATDRLKQLAPKRFNFIADADTTVDGFIAHEVQTVVPEAITGTHNEVDADGNPVYQGIDQSKLVPLLVATIKELEARITALEAK